MTRREAEVLTMVSLGFLEKEVGLRLNLSRNTVKQHLAACRWKLDAATTTAACCTAIRMGLIP